MWRLASITGPLVDFATKFIDDVGLAGLFVLMTLESACIPIPSEATMLFAGFDVSKGKWSLLEITLVGSVANLVGSWIAYAIGYFGRVELLEKHGRKLHISSGQLARADRWFERYGSAAVFFSRMLPIVRTFISLPAGVARMPFMRFSLLTFLGCVPWVFALGFIGKQVGSNWEDWRHSLEYFDYAVGGLIVVGVIYLLVRRGRGRNEPAADVPG
jgi:membrane protein DedA with SNARE-associated domain